MQPFNPKVTIIIPVFNGANFLREAIDSALSQTYKNTEIIVVNDGSDDHNQTENIALSYANKIIYIKKQNGGVASALNEGIRQMTGEYFSWLSHDDLYKQEKILDQVNALVSMSESQRNKSIIYSNFSVFDEQQCKEITLKKVDYSFRLWLTLENSLHGCTLLIPKKAFEKYGNFNEVLKTTQDYDMWFRLAETYNFYLVQDSLVKARSHSEQGSRKIPLIVLEECDNLISNFLSQLSIDDIKSNKNLLQSVVYLKLISSMHRRNFINSRNLSIRLFITYLSTKSKKIMTKIFQNILNIFKPKNTSSEPSIESASYQDINNLSLRDKFTKVYKENIFEGRLSKSGEGSDLIQTFKIRESLPKVLSSLNVKTIIDAPCGDWFWMKEVNLDMVDYIGIDIVPDLIERNTNQFQKSNIRFQCLDIANENLPSSDLIFCRDCLVHLSYDDAKKIISNFKKSGAKYLLTTSFVERNSNKDLGSGFWRPLNLELKPFNFPKPILKINENCTEAAGKFSDKSLCLWSLQDI
ncbi:glycosyltransferase [Polynucleobacter sp. 15G-AUS-farblos]|uniref:glycosyltransferase n=1 Tax=Polynucleobacter sp. 15G-AUS-farblos TaxID=2689094 RepID=UPI001C0AD83B|nr:glycosyltransferase [Polynucleobacter sp. 15G-AUS-farblos]MBU3584096.1 glycosyltransferase [Polynucleobacter sp. 15G-AUS-farblos]